MMALELWLRPWALLTGDHYRIDLARHAQAGAEPPHIAVPAGHDGPLFVYTRGPKLAHLDRRAEGLAEHGALIGKDEKKRPIGLLPYPRDPARGWLLRCGEHRVQLYWPDAPTQPSMRGDQTEAQAPGVALYQRVEMTWTRLRDVENALMDPLAVWDTVADLWTSADSDARDPMMEPIALQARALPRNLDQLEQGARRILRRRHAMMPVSRVQEVDRRSMLWLTRQPGETLAERAGPAQRIQAVARFESYDTLENRVLHSYASLARREALDYCDRYKRAAGGVRHNAVAAFAKRCQRLHRRLSEEDRQVGEARPDVTPNFVLQNNPHYNAIWNAWHALLRRNRTIDELWLWQARAFEEFCAVAAMVALHTLPGAKLIAAAPLNFLEEQDRGRWLAHDNPLGVFYLARQKRVIEVQHRPDGISKARRDFGAPIWLRIGDLDNARGFQQRVAIWPLAGPSGGLVDGEAELLAPALERAGRNDLVRAGLIIRSASPEDDTASRHLVKSGPARILTTTLAPAGPALRDGIAGIAEFVAEQIALEG